MQAKYRKKYFEKNTFYHVYNRGVDKQEIFRKQEDFVYYLSKMRQFKQKYKIVIVAYALLKNHYHQLLYQMSDSPINAYMQVLGTSYGIYFNRKYNRVGPLMQDRYKQAVLDPGHLPWYSVYVNCNYEIHDLGVAEDYQWTSYLDYIEIRNGTLCDKKLVLNKVKNNYFEFCKKIIPEIREEKGL